MRLSDPATLFGATLGQVAEKKGGVALAATIALAASFLGEHYGAPAMLFALLLGMAFNFLAHDDRAAPGIAFCSNTVLRLGVGLLGLQLTFGDISQLGPVAVIAVVAMLVLTLLAGIGIARVMGRPLAFGLLTGGSVAICGVSAALAIAAALPRGRVREEDVLLTVIGVTALSTVAMVLYPVLFVALGLSDIESGYLIGATIHDVAQVVGAGYSISEEAGEIATFTKLLRVAMLPLILIAIGLGYRGAGGGAKARLPWFVVMFVLLMAVRNLLPLPDAVLEMTSGASRFMLVTAIAALGVRTSLKQIFAAGPRGVIVIGLETLCLLLMALGFTAIMR
ncbi:YeiH family protein [Paracoccus sp. SCSIO 75233]|uniref:YeiH family protein n=1 Tax=Paracoccus sp. SCSIO 75233 TaxID=3017782 RepID=UPI0022EFF772|nr:putative sulfate exporter family transporter [Paracoccus sp. SCSIO 75233]WBU55238.1 putative sulfate exporter family transporter [Paracoccus sp. SCSIO 75233]